MPTTAEWLASLGMSKDTQSALPRIEFSALRHLTDQDLRDIGVLLGHRGNFGRRQPGVSARRPVCSDRADLTCHPHPRGRDRNRRCAYWSVRDVPEADIHVDAGLVALRLS